MRKVGRWIQKWTFLLTVFVFGIVYACCAGGWRLYTRTPEGAGQGDGRWQGNYGAGGGTGAETDLQTPLEEDPLHTPEDLPLDLQDSQEVQGEEGEGAPPQEALVLTEEPVGNEYFADAVFIGDSRTVGLYEYGGLEETAQFYASTGLTVYKLFSAEIVEVPGQKEKISVEEALTENSFSKIYLMIGINEMGTGTVDSFIEAYAEAVEHLKELQPDAVIYLQGIMKVTKERSDKGDYINNEGIEARNERIAGLADGERVFYLDVNPEVCDGTGGMVQSYTYDGVHLKAQYIPLWLDFLKANALVKVLLD